MNSANKKKAAPSVPPDGAAESGKNMAIIVPALYYITSSFRMEGFL